MTTLIESEIIDLIRSKKLKIHPILDSRQIGGCKIDLRLSNTLYLIKHYQRPFYDPAKEEELEYGDYVAIAFDGKFVLQPGEFVLALLFERVSLPPFIFGRLDGRSSLGRLGIIVQVTASAVDPGYAGDLVLELANVGKVPVALYPLMRIASLSLEKLSREVRNSYKSGERKYPSRIYTALSKDYEFRTGLLEKVSSEF